ncbi:MAG: molybdopterin-guanine dinucleotide biosynthesis protein B, partial [Peptococcaceae bacterium]|nr:molybdopterin-guanine dinucleotide biosynthesis protein B [Peptococcaceae bacterium]
MKQQTVIAISGVKNSGKTTLIQRILPKLTAEGLNVAVIKHDGHTFQADPVDTDTGKYIEAGAYGTAIFDGEKYKIIKHGTIDEQDLIQLFPEADVILLEGLKY